MNQNFDVVVIGAGYIGLSAAYYLSTAGLNTALFDQGGVAAGASSANYGNIQIQDMELTKSVELTQLGIRHLNSVEEELDWNIGKRKIGGLLPIENEQQWDIMQKRQAVLLTYGIPSELIPAKNLPEIEPFLNTNILLGGLYHPNEGQVDPFSLIWAYLTRAKQNGLTTFFHNKVTGLNIINNKVVGIKTISGDFGAKHVVICTGAFTNRLAQSFGRKWNIHYVLGQAMVTEPVNLLLRNHLASASFFEEGVQVKKGTTIANMAISQSEHGHILIGEAMREADHFSTVVPAVSLPMITNAWLKFFPSLKNLRILRSWSAPVADTPDGLPILGPVKDIAGLYVATAFRSTVIVTPLVGKTITQLITTGKTELDIRFFHPERNKSETNQ
jgi:sarcosine oxidase subunit beta